jgi:hypothetical protein
LSSSTGQNKYHLDVHISDRVKVAAYICPMVTSNMAVALTQKLIQYGFDPDKFRVNGIPDVSSGSIGN